MKLLSCLSVFLFFAPVWARDLRPLPVPEERLTPPAGFKAAEWNQIRAEYQRHRHTAFPDGNGGFTSRNRQQQWRAQFDRRGVEIRPDSKAWTWGLDLVEFSGQPIAAAAAAQVNVARNRVTYRWVAGLEEWYLNEPRGMEHGFVVSNSLAATPSQELTFTLRVRGGLRPVTANNAAMFVDAAGKPVMNYAGLTAFDAHGRKLPAVLTASAQEIRIAVDVRGAAYPVTVDPVAQQAYLKPNSVGSSQANDAFGASVAISGDTLVVGARGDDSTSLGVNSIPNEAGFDCGSAYVFVRSGGVWTQQAYLRPAAVSSIQNNDQFGYSVAISGDTIVVGSPYEDSGSLGVNSTPDDSSTDSGAVYVFVRSNGSWNQQAYIKPNAVGDTQRGDRLGFSVAISGDTLVAGAPNEASSTVGVNSTPNEFSTNAGCAYIWVRANGIWSQQAYLKPQSVGTTQAGDSMGLAVSISGDTVVVGSPGESTAGFGVNPPTNENALVSGAAYVYSRGGVTWTQQAFLKPAAVGSTQVQDLMGASVAIDGDTLVVGSPFEDGSAQTVNGTVNEGATDRGAAYVFTRTGTIWSQQAYLKPSLGVESVQYFGISSAISSNTIIIGSDAANGTGMAWTFTRNAGVWTQQTKLQAANPGSTAAGDAFGIAVSVSGDTVVVGASGEDSASTGVNSIPDENASGAGAAYVFTGVSAANTPLQFVPVTPCRLVDTRNPNGPLGGPFLSGLTSRNFPIRSACSLPANSTAYSLNVTVVPRGPLGYLTIWPGGVSQPLVSTLNSLDGRVKANAAVVPAGGDGSVNVFVTNNTDVILDVNGVWVPQGSNSSAQPFYSVTPCRILDTRVAGNGGTLAATTQRAVQVANAGGCGIPTTATAYALNVTVVPKTTLGFLTLWTGGSNSPRPTVSTLNAVTGTVTANMAIVPAGSAGDINAYATDATELIVDVTGYFAPAGGSNALNFYTLTPCRIADTRLATGSLGGPVLSGGSTRDFPVLSSPCNVPSTASAYSMNATVLPQPILGFLTLFPTGVTRPVVSTLNAVDGSLTANAALVPAGTGGQLAAFVSETTHFILDINGYFAP